MAKNTQKDQLMAQYMKEHGIVRTTARCPICYTVLSLKALTNHIAYHK